MTQLPPPPPPGRQPGVPPTPPQYVPPAPAGPPVQAGPPLQYGYVYGSVPMIVRTNGLAIASMVCSIASIFLGLLFVPEILGIVFGHVAMGQINRSQGRERGTGQAVAGLVIGYLSLAFWVLILIVAANGSSS